MEEKEHTTMHPQCIPPYTLVGGPENIKLLFDEQLDSRREVQARQRAWEALALRNANNAESFDVAVRAVSLLSAQIGVSQGQVAVPMTQAPIGPIRTAAADNLAAGAAPSNRVIDAVTAAAAGTEAVAASAIAASIGKLAEALVPIIVASGGVVSAEALAAILPSVIAAAGKSNGPAKK